MLEGEAYTVSQLTELIASYINEDPYLTNIEVVGEVVDVKIRGNHLYFGLVDDEARISCVYFGGGGVDLANGEVVRVGGSVRVYKKRGTYNFYVSYMRRVGSFGKYAADFSRLFLKLKAEGVFDRPKKPIPPLPINVGIITSLESAALRDILKTFREKAPLVIPRIFGVQVQGEDAPLQISEAVKMAKEEELDVLIIARGGGSSDDLWVFNDERVLRAVMDLPFPLVTGIGHAIDSVILDKLADVDAHTPTAAAEIIAQKHQEYFSRLEDAMDRIALLAKPMLDQAWEELRDAFESVSLSYERLLTVKKEKLKGLLDIIMKVSSLPMADKIPIFENLISRIFRGFSSLLESKARKLDSLVDVVSKVSPLRTLERGFAILLKEGSVVRSKGELRKGDELEVILKDGKVRVRVDEV